MKEFFETIYRIFVTKGGFAVLLKGVGNTLLIAFTAVLIGVVIGSLCATVQVSESRNPIMRAVKFLVRAYVTVIRGTPVTVQLLFTYFGVFATAFKGNPNKAIIIAIIVFGLNSGAYDAEIIRGGILSVDKGQTEAGRSLGLTNGQTMLKIVLPQAIKNIIPALGNELIILIKDSSVASFITVVDLTKRAQELVTKYYVALPIYLMLALFYLALTSVAAWGVKKIEKRMRASDNR